MVVPLLVHGAVPFLPSDPDRDSLPDARICIHVCYDTLHQWILADSRALSQRGAPVNLPDIVLDSRPVVESTLKGQCLESKPDGPRNDSDGDKTLATWARVGRDLRLIADQLQHQRPAATATRSTTSPATWISTCLVQTLLLFCGWKLGQWVAAA